MLSFLICSLLSHQQTCILTLWRMHYIIKIINITRGIYMNKILPSKNEIKPITNVNSTFYECGFNQDFENLPFINKLQIINDLVRQSMLPERTPNPVNDKETLIGDCYTSAIASIEYMKNLNIGTNHRLVFCRKRPYDPDNITSRHAAVLVDDEEGNTYFYDATPYVGSNYGKVLPDQNFYEHYEIIDNEKSELIFFLRELIYKHNNSLLKLEDIPFYTEVVFESIKHQFLNNYTSKAFEILARHFDNKFDQDRYIQLSIQANPYTKLNPENKKFRDLRSRLMLNQIDVWKEELNDLILSKSNLKRQLELAQNIYQEMKVMNPCELEKYVQIFGQKIPMTSMTPRFFKEHNLNIIMIKPSAYYAGVSATIRERFLNRGNGVLYEYKTNLTDPTPITNITPMLFSHPLGDKYQRAMNGTSDVILLSGSAKDLYRTKKQLRNELCKNLKGREVTWYDGEKILWHPAVTNLVHSTDNPSEASMHFMIGYPEQQVMTRFMYPNPRLEEDYQL